MKKRLPPLRMSEQTPKPQKPEPVPEPPPVSPALVQHHANLATLVTEVSALQHLSDLWRNLDAELEAEEAAVESTVEAILAGSATDAKLSESGHRRLRVAGQKLARAPAPSRNRKTLVNGRGSKTRNRHRSCGHTGSSRDRLQPISH
jgi:hypothetical protein